MTTWSDWSDTASSEVTVTVDEWSTWSDWATSPGAVYEKIPLPVRSTVARHVFVQTDRDGNVVGYPTPAIDKLVQEELSRYIYFFSYVP